MNMKRRPALPIEYETKPETEIDKALHEALRAKMREVLDKDLTVRTLTELAQFAEYARALIIVGKAPGQLQGRGSNYAQAVGQAIMGSINVGYSNNEIMGDSSALSGAPAAETFGTTAIREIVAAVAKLKEKDSPAELVKAIAAAKEAKLDTLAAKLEEKLFSIEKPEPPKPDIQQPVIEPLPEQQGDGEEFEAAGEDINDALGELVAEEVA